MSSWQIFLDLFPDIVLCCSLGYGILGCIVSLVKMSLEYKEYEESYGFTLMILARLANILIISVLVTAITIIIMGVYNG